MLPRPLHSMAPAAGLLVVLCADVAAQEAPAPLPAGEPALSWTFGDGVRVRVSDMEARIRTRLHMDLFESKLEDVEMGDSSPGHLTPTR